MFSGIIIDTFDVASVQLSAAGGRLGIMARYDHLMLGDSVAINGVCLSLVGKDQDEEELLFDVSLETLKRTNLSDLKVGDPVNLELPLKVGDYISGHLVTGHIDGKLNFLEKAQTGESWRLVFEVPQDLRGYFSEKGAICLNGVSLTVGEVLEDRFYTYIIPYTYKKTNLGQLEVGQKVNFEVDIIARYVGSLLKARGVLC